MDQVSHLEATVRVGHDARLVTWYRWNPTATWVVIVEPGATHDYLVPVIDQLGAATYDPIGNGRSRHLPPDAIDHIGRNLAADELAAILEALPGPRRLVSHHSACIAALDILALSPELLSEMVLVAPRLGPPPARLDPFATEHASSPWHDATRAWISADPRPLEHWRTEVAPSVRDALRVPASTSTVAVRALVDADDTEARTLAETLGVPTEVFPGRDLALADSSRLVAALAR